MEWQDEGLVIGARKHGETSVILELMTRAHGRHLGVVRGGRSKAMRPVLQPGNLVAATWRARLEDHMGAYAVEPLALRAARFLDRAAALHGVTTLAALLRLLPERDPHEGLFDMAEAIAVRLDSPNAAAPLMAQFELALLGALGFGLDLQRCAVTGTRDDLAYVSPKTGRAVNREAAAPWRDRLLPYPHFLREETESAPTEEIADAFRLTGYFLTRDVLTPRGATLPASRALYIAALR
ncbi:DNA repair protein RecO [Methylocystis sp. MJC1]|jgi:DNA repair protein RecO (recombination protein O)|uniref:DNA repair protein RecO n=1 Tax=Methylocystis sp. MJC1 TaxID=2654282 RepID=UPI0013EA3538|nr:DNA repair protein RecO [Methylocystis sp. MJC1]KAF2990206.1 DNA repair protein RecO [Methylocystis sp. MJC1]MBU6528097.1 DNA repair protein RecO [Methylocystis sp. MJC1]UZX11013.1 DNA repair protein RecO [Methylocystis sp. MJC1]